MNHFTYHYLSHHPQIKKALFCIDKKSTILTLQDLIKESAIKEAFVYSGKAIIDHSSLKKISEADVRVIKKDQLNKIGLQNSDFYVIFIDVEDKSIIEDVKKAKPLNVLFDYMLDGEFDYSIWEEYRTFAKTIKIAKKRCPITYRLLDWEKDENSDIELSVIFPMYNVAKYLPELIKNITSWKAPYVEFIFVNDGSPDNSADVIKEYQKKDKRIKLLNKENGGCASAREFGLINSKGRYVSLIDPDDFTDKDMLKELLFTALSGTYDISYCGYNEYYNDTKKINPVPDILWPPYDNGTEDREAINKLIPFLRVGIWRMLFRRKFLEENNIHFYTDLRRFDDLPFKVETLLYAKSVIAIPKHLYYYRLERAGQDIAANDQRLYVHFDIFKHLDKRFEGKSAGKLMDLYHVVKIHTHNWAIHKLKKEFLNEYLSLAKKDLLAFYSKKEIKNVAALYCRDMRKTVRKILSAK